MFSKLKSKDAVTTEVTEVDSQSTMSNDKKPSHLEEGAVQTYKINYDNWKSIKAVVKDSETDELLYKIDLPTITKSRVTIRNPSDDSEIGYGKPNMFKMKLTAELRGQDLALKCRRMLSADYVYTSPFFNNATMTWKANGWKDLQYTLVDDQSLPVARWTVKGSWAAKNLGVLEFLGTKADSKEAREEILVTGLTVIQLMMQSRASASAGASSAGSAAAVAGS